MEEVLLTQVDPELRKILLIGPEGTGKTHFIKTMPKPIYIFSFDKGIASLAGESGIKAGIFLDSDRTQPKAYREFLQKLGQIEIGEKFRWEDGKEEAYRTLAIDGFTMLTTKIFDDAQWTNSRVNKPAEFPTWAAVKSQSQDVINRMVKCSQYVACTVLQMSEKDELTGELFFVPNTEGKIRDEMGAWFDAVFYTTVDKSKENQPIWEMLLVGSARHRAKIRIPSSLRKFLKEKEPNDWAAIMDKVKAAKAEGGK